MITLGILAASITDHYVGLHTLADDVKMMTTTK